MGLIDKNKLLEKIEELDAQNNCGTSDFIEAKRIAFRQVKQVLDSLEVKEVDLKKELDYDDYMAFFKEHPEYNNGDWGFEETWIFAQYCYKLVLKAQKGG